VTFLARASTLRAEAERMVGTQLIPCFCGVPVYDLLLDARFRFLLRSILEERGENPDNWASLRKG